jgi:flagellar biosynthesis protein
MATNRGTPRQLAIALAYKEGQRAPSVVGKGRGLMAETIIERARQAGVFVHESPELVSLLMQVDLDQHIPPELYRAVAEILAFIYFLEHRADQSQTPVPPVFKGPDVLPDEGTS